jgi:hypothetical protein
MSGAATRDDDEDQHDERADDGERVAAQPLERAAPQAGAALVGVGGRSLERGRRRRSPILAR